MPTKAVGRRDAFEAGDSFQEAHLVVLREAQAIVTQDIVALDIDSCATPLTFAATCIAVTYSGAATDPPRRSDLRHSNLCA